MKDNDRLGQQIRSQLYPLLADLSDSLFAPEGGVEKWQELRQKLQEKATSLGLSSQELKQIKSEFDESLAANARPGGITKLPELKEVDFGYGIAPFSLSAYVQEYVGWQIEDKDTITDGAWWLRLGRNYFGNSDIETKQLLFFFQENPEKVADYLEHIWPVPDVKPLWTDPFLAKAREGSLKRITFEET